MRIIQKKCDFNSKNFRKFKIICFKNGLYESWAQFSSNFFFLSIFSAKTKYKDLKLQNPYSFPIQINLSIVDYQLECIFRSEQALSKKEIFFEKADLGDKIEISMLLKADSTPILLQKSVYKKNI